MTNEPDIIETPREYYITRRVSGHNDWTFAFWRELFQNSVDAKAKRIDITIGTMPGRSATWKAGTVPRVITVAFSDDGTGISEKVLKEVFFKTGMSTKSGGESTGGFGTARLMLCFSQLYYRIRTGSFAVEGTGSRYKIRKVPEAIEAILVAISDAEDASAVARTERERVSGVSLDALVAVPPWQDSSLAERFRSIPRVLAEMAVATPETAGSQDMADSMHSIVTEVQRVSRGWGALPTNVNYSRLVEDIRHIVASADRAANGRASGPLYELFRLAVAEADVVRFQERAEKLRDDISQLQAEPAVMKGTRFEIDIDPYESDYHGNNATEQKMIDRLDTYLSMSQVPCKVFVNGSEVTTKTLRGPARRTLITKDEKGNEVTFGTVHLSSSENRKHKNCLIVRQSGSAMYFRSTSSSQQVIVELEPSIGKRILMDNRDGLTGVFSKALDTFMEELAVNSQTALRDVKKSKHISIRGGLGTIKLTPTVLPVSKKIEYDFSSKPSLVLAGKAVIGASPNRVIPDIKSPTRLNLIAELVEVGNSVDNFKNMERSDLSESYDIDSDNKSDVITDNREVVAPLYISGTYEREGFGGISAPVMNSFLETVAGKGGTFLSDHPDKHYVEVFVEDVKARGSAALADISHEMGTFLVSELSNRVEMAIAASGVDSNSVEVPDNRFADLHDIHIQVEDIGDNPKLQNAVRRYSPGFWRREGAEGKHVKGRGLQAHLLLSMWTVCCKHAVDALFLARPELAAKGLIEIGTGFRFSKSEERWNGKSYSMQRIGATQQEMDGTHILLLNPVFDNGTSAWDLTKKRRVGLTKEDGTESESAMSDLWTLACHEVAHIVRGSHDEEFASALTDIVGLFDLVAANKEMQETSASVRAMYGTGKTLVQAMDVDLDPIMEEEEKPKKKVVRTPRPAEVVLARAVPILAMVAGVVSAPENVDFRAPCLREAFEELMVTGADGVVTVDCDALNKLNADITVAMKETAAPIISAPLEVDPVVQAIPDLSFLETLSFGNTIEMTADPVVDILPVQVPIIQDVVQAIALPVTAPAGGMAGLAMFANFTGDLSLRSRAPVVPIPISMVAVPMPDLDFLESFDMGAGIVAAVSVPDIQVSEPLPIPDAFTKALAAATEREILHAAVQARPKVADKVFVSDIVDSKCLAPEDFSFDDEELGFVPSPSR